MNEVNSSAVLEMVVRATQLGWWEWEIGTERTFYSAGWKRQLGYADEELSNGLDEWRSRVHPEDLARLQRVFSEYLAAPTSHYESEFRMRHRDGAWRWIRAFAHLIFDSEGRPQRLLGSHLDITEFKRNELALSQANRMLRLRTEANAAVTRVADELTFLRHVCHAAVHTGGYAGAWVLSCDSNPQVRAEAGEVASELVGLDESDPVTAALRTGEPQWARAGLRWSDENSARVGQVLENGTILVLPLLVEGDPCGVLVVRATVEDEMGPAQAAALLELAHDVAVGVQMMRTRLERDRAMQALSRSESRLEVAERIAHVGCWEWNRLTREVFLSAEAYRIFGLPSDGGCPETGRLLELVHPEDRDRVRRLANDQVFQDGVAETEFRVVRPDGTTRYVLSRVAGPGGERTANSALLIGTVQDITDRRRAEDVLRANIARALCQEATLLELMRPGTLPQGDLPAALQRLTEAAARALGVARVSVWRLTEDRQAIECLDLFDLATEQHSSGGRLSAASCPRYFAGLADAEVLTADDARSDPRTAELDESYLRPLGITALMDVPLRLKDEVAGVLCHEHIGEPRRWTPEERTFALAISGLATLCFEEDARRRAQEERAKSEQAYAALVSSVDGIVWEVELPSYRFLYVSPQAERLLGYPIDRWINDANFWIEHMHPDDRAWAPLFCERATAARQDHEFYYRMVRADGQIVWLHDLVTVVLENGVPCRLRGIMVDVTETKRAEEALHAREQEYRALVENSPDVVCRYGRDGRRIYVNLSGEKLFNRGRSELVGTRGVDEQPGHPGLRRFYELLQQVLATGRPAELDLELDYLSLPNPPIHYVRLVPERDPQGNVVSVLGIGRDITAMRETERKLRESEERLRQSQKMEAVGRLAGGIAHDFNNLLAVIQLQSDLLLADSSPESMREGVEEIKAAAERASNLTRQLLTFSRRGMPQVRVLDLAEVLSSISVLLRRLLGEDIALETRFARGLPQVQADRGMMEQVIMNLAVNARDAMPDGGRLLIELAVEEVDAGRAEARPGVEPGTFVSLTVTDTGCGIREDDLPHVFEPFFTTKDVGRGTGLGLSTVFGIVQQHRGWVEVSSTAGQGATFGVFLPAAPHSVAAPATQNRRAAPSQGTERILLVEDDLAVRPLTQMALERHGYSVIAADSGVEALALWEEHGDSVDLLLTDLVMPGGVSGAQLAERLLAERPGLKVIYMSGYSDDVIERRLPAGTEGHFLSKPFSMGDLLAQVRRCLAK